MTRLIDADALIHQVESPYTEYTIMIQIRRAIKNFIKDAPTVDAVPVVRCKDCKHYRPHEISKGLPYCEWNGSLTYDDEFCSHAERREE